MRVGTLEIQLMADMARLSKDMKQAERVVGGAMNQVERSVASAKAAIQSLGAGLSIALIANQMRQMSDAYSTLDAQMRLATKTQERYKLGMADVRRISSVAQADLLTTSMLYTRLINVTEGTGISQAKLATVTETVAFGLKAYGASQEEAASAALQLSQAMGANRLGGEEFRAVMESMPNVMKVLADSMGVTIGELKDLSAAGKITTDEMVKAFGNPAIAAEFKKLAENARTITGSWAVMRNELMLVVGEFMKSSGATNALMAGFDGVSVVIRLIADNMNILLNAFYAFISVTAGKMIVSVISARIATAELSAANLAQAQAALFAAKANLTGAAAAARAGGSAKAASVAMREYAAASAAVAAAEKAQSASSMSIAGRVKGAVGRAGWVGMAIFGAWTVYDFLNGMQSVADGAKKLNEDLAGMTLQQAQLARQKELIHMIGLRDSVLSRFNEREIRASQDRLREYDKQIAKLVEVANAENAAAMTPTTSPKVLELQRKNDAEVAAASFEFWKKEDEKRLAEQQRAEQEAIARRKKDHEDLWKSIDTTAHDTFVNMLDGNKNVATRLRDTFKNVFFDFLYQMTAKKWLVSVESTFTPGSAASGMLSSAMPYIVGGLLAGGLLMSAFDAGAAEKVGGNRLVGQFSKTGFTGEFEQSWMRQGGVFAGTQNWVERTAVTTAQQRAFTATVNGLQKTFNTLGSAIGDTALKTRAWTVDVNQAGDVTGMLADGIGMQLVPALENLRAEGETLADTAVRLTAVFQSTNDFIAALGLSSMQAFGAAGVLSAAQRADLVASAGGEQAFSAVAGAFISSILTPSEQLQVSLNKVGRVFSELNIAGVETNAQFAELVRQTLQAGDYSAVGALLSVSDAFAQITKSAQVATDQLLALVKASSFSTFADYQRMMASIAASTTQAAIPAVGGAAAPGGATTGIITAATAAAGGALAQEQVAADTARNQAAKAQALRALQNAQAQAFVMPSRAWVGSGDNGRYVSIANLPNVLGGQAILNGLLAKKTASDTAIASAQAYYDSLPAFANGGVHSGGLRLVGENGPEVEYTGPSTVYSSSDTTAMFDNRKVVESVDALREELRAIGIAVSGSTQRTAKILDRWDGQGMPEVREAL